jgi:hypothetical protein
LVCREKYPEHLEVLRNPLGLRKVDGSRVEAPPLIDFAWLAGGLLLAYLVLVILGKVRFLLMADGRTQYLLEPHNLLSWSSASPVAGKVRPVAMKI